MGLNNDFSLRGQDSLVEIGSLCLAEWHRQKKRFSFIFHPCSHHPCGSGRVHPLLFSSYPHTQSFTRGILANVHLLWWYSCRPLIITSSLLFLLSLPGLIALCAHCCFQEMETEDGDYHHLSSKITGLCAIPADVKVSCDWQK